MDEYPSGGHGFATPESQSIAYIDPGSLLRVMPLTIAGIQIEGLWCRTPDSRKMYFLA